MPIYISGRKICLKCEQNIEEIESSRMQTPELLKEIEKVKIVKRREKVRIDALKKRSEKEILWELERIKRRRAAIAESEQTKNQKKIKKLEKLEQKINQKEAERLERLKKIERQKEIKILEELEQTKRRELEKLKAWSESSYKNILLLDLIRLFLEEGKNKYKKHTLGSYSINLNEFYLWNKNKLFNEITQEDIDKFAERIAGRYPNEKTFDGFMYSLRALWKFGEEYNVGKKVEIPILKFDKTPKVKFIKAKDFDDIIESIYYEKQTSEVRNINIITIRDLAILQLLIETGIKIGELCNIQFEDINFDKKTLKIKEESRVDRKLPVKNGTIILIQDYLEKIQSYNRGHLFQRHDRGYQLTNTPITSRSVQRMIKYHSNGKFSSKDFRYTFIVIKLLEGFGIWEISDMIGGISHDTKGFYWNYFINKNLGKIKITERDYNAYEYLRHTLGTERLREFIIHDKINVDFKDELKKKLIS